MSLSLISSIVQQIERNERELAASQQTRRSEHVVWLMHKQTSTKSLTRSLERLIQEDPWKSTPSFAKEDITYEST